MQHDDLDRILVRRAAVPRARTDLAERIIHAALTSMPDKARVQGWWAELMTMLVLPSPSVAVATGIIFGLALGIQAGDGMSFVQQDWSSFLDINEGGWL